MYFTQFSSWYKIVHSFGHIPVKFHCDGSIFWYTQTPTYVKVTTVCKMTTVHLYACLTAMMHSLNNILNAYLLNIILFLDKTLRPLRNIYWRWYLVFHAIAHNTLTYPMGDITADMTGYSITYMSFVCRTFSVKRAVWAGALSCWNTLHRSPPLPPLPPPHLGDV